MKKFLHLALLNGMMAVAVSCLLFACNSTGTESSTQKDSAQTNTQEQSSETTDTTKSPYPPLDKSPMDMAYYPPGYSMTVNVQGKPGKLIARVIYSRPQMNGREIFGKLVPFGEVWRLGANQATELDIYAPVTIGGHNVQPGRYTLYAIPQPDKWTIILNSQTDTRGAYGYHENKDVLRTDVSVSTLDSPVEAFSMVFEQSDQGCNLVIVWDKTEAKLPIVFSEK